MPTYLYISPNELSPFYCRSTSHNIFIGANLEHRYILALLVANSQHLTELTLVSKVDIKAQRTIIGQILNR